MDNILEQICAAKKKHVEQKQSEIPLSEIQLGLKKQSAHNEPTEDAFRKNILKKKEENLPALIAEVKKRSPSKGVLREDFSPSAISKGYELGGATCISVLTDTPYFDGCDQDLLEVKSTVKLPVLRKDFVVDLYQIYESAYMNAESILLIVAALNDSDLKEFYHCAKDLGLSVLVETHNRIEVERALNIDADMIGVNARNLKTLDVDVNIVTELKSFIPQDTVSIAESGITSAQDLYRMFDLGFDAFLVGESLIRQENVEMAVRNILKKS